MKRKQTLPKNIIKLIKNWTKTNGNQMKVKQSRSKIRQKTAEKTDRV